MTPEERAKRLVGEIPWLTELLPAVGMADDLQGVIGECLSAAVAEEREACAKISEDIARASDETKYSACHSIAERIRERSNFRKCFVPR